MPDPQSADLSLTPPADPGVTPPLMLDANIGHYEAIYKKCWESSGRLVWSDPGEMAEGLSTRLERRVHVTDVLFKRFCDDQAEAAKARQLTNSIEGLLGMLGARR